MKKPVRKTREIYYDIIQNQYGVMLNDLNLSVKELFFIIYLCNHGFNSPGRALKASHMTYKGEADAHVKGLRMMQDQRIRTAITRLIESIMAPYRERLEYQLLTTWYNRAFYNFCDFYDETKDDKGHVHYVMKPMSELTDDQVAAIDGIDFGKSPHYILAKRQDALSSLKDALFEAQKERMKTPDKQDSMRSVNAGLS